MTMDAEKRAKVEEFIETNEQTQGLGKLAEAIADVAGAKKELKEKISNWLKNDKNLLDYAELTIEDKPDIPGYLKRLKLEIQLSFTCTYFAEFKNFLQELKRGNDTSTTDNRTSASSTEIGNMGTSSTGTKTSETTSEASEALTRTFCGTNVYNILSEPFEQTYNSEGKKVTWCSKTAQANGRKFGMILPSGDAYNAGTHPGKDSLKTIPQNKINIRPQNTWKGINANIFTSITEGNYADIYTDTKSPKFGHRAVAFKDDSGQWYVLDPYTRVNGKLDNSPKKLEDYLKFRKIVKANIYESKGYIGKTV